MSLALTARQLEDKFQCFGINAAITRRPNIHKYHIHRTVLSPITQHSKPGVQTRAPGAACDMLFHFTWTLRKSCSNCRIWHIPVFNNLRGGIKKNYFFTWFIRFCTITTLVSFKVLSFWLDTLVQTLFPLLETFLELFSADVVQDLQCFLFHFADISKTFPFHQAVHTREQEKVAWRKVGWIGRIRDNRRVVFLPKTAAHSRPCG